MISVPSPSRSFGSTDSSSASGSPLERRLTAEICRQSLVDFVREGWHVLEPATEYVHGQHIDAICLHLEAVSDGRIRKLLINVPPGFMKSLIVSVFWPAWEWLKRPGLRDLVSSYNDTLVLRDAVKCRYLMESAWYRETFRPTWQFTGDQNAKSFYTNTQGGFRYSHTVGGGGTGHRGDRIVVDDPLKVEDAYSQPARQLVIRWWTQTMSNRLGNMQTGAKVIIMQRLHEEDLAGHILATDPEFEHLCLPAEFDPDHRCRTSIGWEDPRTERGQLLFPEMFPASVLAQEKKTKGSAGYAGQYQQRPMPASGGMFQREWWRFWRRASESDLPGYERRTVVLPDTFDETLLSFDCAFKKTDDGSKVAGGAWARKGASKFLLDLRWDFMDFNGTCAALKELAVLYPDAHAKLVEAKANGEAVVNSLSEQVTGLIAVEPEGGKESRAAATSPQVEAGNVFLPLHAPWRDAYIDEHAQFPRGSKNDAVDQQSQALTRWLVRAPTFGDGVVAGRWGRRR